ncbi:MAG: hypothetical protein PHE54_01680 [Bacilli bacterium]|nr:hypothetical protein [Bacilli bacterium]
MSNIKYNPEMLRLLGHTPEEIRLIQGRNCELRGIFTSDSKEIDKLRYAGLPDSEAALAEARNNEYGSKKIR